MNPYVPKRVKVLNIRKETEDIATFKLGYKLKHEPGQFVLISLLGIGECPISICSYSTNFIELCIRKVGNVTRALHKIKKNSYVYIRGPYGNGYPMKEFRKKPLLIIGGGTGVAPLRSVIQYTIKNKTDFPDLKIFLGFKEPKDVLFRDDIIRWRKVAKVELTVDKGAKGWDGHVGVITELLKKFELNNKAIVLVCGPPIMIRFVIQLLKNQNFRDEQIYVSLERQMKCGIGLCGHCRIKDKLVCQDGPVFHYKIAKELID